MDLSANEQTHFWRAPQLGGVELLHARYIEHTFSPHVHEGFVLGVVEQGAHLFQHRGSGHLASVGSMIVINPDELHSCSKAGDQGWRYRACYPDAQQIRGVLQELELDAAGLPGFASSVIQDLELTRAFAELHCLLDGPATVLQCQVAWREAILLLFQRHGRVREAREPGREPWAVAQAKALLDSRLADPPSLEQLAAAVSLSPFHFARVFRRATGLPPHAWLRQRRLQQARAQLQRGSTPLAVAMQLGFADQSHLSRQFKQAYGVTPGEYRKACGA
ncbi:AraC family transcriptional regulator [Pseudomonas benzenivorans]|uniref:AraC family transcriptional regulator n=1 Tax=Pseudomonas benzenivorans TaxID=556533 RepID=A0ABZ0PRP4_9PSED|nr:AraC family transcriptional regulator [Pseudomonas benzenivorans]WPC03838.1 AraC family transcriptional regulator [Pseudomonas benzenivorans]